MRKVVFILVLVLLTGSISFVNAQDATTKVDVITLKVDGSEIRAKVTEVGPNDSYFKYKLNNQGVLSEQEYVLQKGEVFKIVYGGNGKVWVNKDLSGGGSGGTGGSGTGGSGGTGGGSGGTGGSGTDKGGGPVDGGWTSPKQSLQKRYAGLGLGVPFIIKRDEGNEGMNGKVQYGANVGYIFKNYFGIAASFAVTSFEYEDDNAVSVGTNTFLIGPLLSFPFSDNKLEYDIRPYIGFVSGKFKDTDVNANIKADETILVYGSGISLRWNVHNFISLALNVDAIYYGKDIIFDISKYSTQYQKMTLGKLSTFSMGVGVNFRF
jgi:hypothetical protein